jgi:hypothetical protein
MIQIAQQAIMISNSSTIPALTRQSANWIQSEIDTHERGRQLEAALAITGIAPHGAASVKCCQERYRNARNGYGQNRPIRSTFFQFIAAAPPAAAAPDADFNVGFVDMRQHLGEAL